MGYGEPLLGNKCGHEPFPTAMQVIDYAGFVPGGVIYLEY